jgi:hypothetical protein
VVERLASSGPAWEETTSEGRSAELPRKRGAGSWVLLIAVLGGGMALTASGTANLHERQQTARQTLGPVFLLAGWSGLRGPRLSLISLDGPRPLGTARRGWAL